MIEFWAVIGLAITDHHFREALDDVKTDRRQLNNLMKEHCFRLSNYELGELHRLISIPEIMRQMKKIHDLYWYRGDAICSTSITFEPHGAKFVTPYLYYNPMTGEFEIPPAHVLNTAQGIVEPDPNAVFDEVSGEWKLS